MAVDNRLIRSVGSPEGVIDAPKGTFYINTQTSGVYVKIDGDANTNSGWVGLLSKGFYTFTKTPAGEVYAPRLAYCYESTDNNLYVQLTESDSPEYVGWTPLTLGNVSILEDDPYNSSLTGNYGDICIDSANKQIYAYYGKWQKLTQLETNSSDIMINLSELLTNVTEITKSYFNLFLNPEPMDISVSQYDDEGTLKTYIIPNRAKDRTAILGTTNPNGSLGASIGTLYLDTTSRILYVKTTGLDDKTGWKAIVYEDKVESPLYIDSASGSICIHTDSTPMENSSYMVASGELYTLFNDKADKAGNSNQTFQVATPVSDNDAVNLDFIKDMFTYDSANGSLKITINGSVYTIPSVTKANQ